MSNSRIHPLFRAAFDDLRDGNAALAQRHRVAQEELREGLAALATAAAKGKLLKDGSRRVRDAAADA